MVGRERKLIRSDAQGRVNGIDAEERKRIMEEFEKEKEDQVLMRSSRHMDFNYKDMDEYVSSDEEEEDFNHKIRDFVVGEVGAGAAGDLLN